MLRPPTMRAWSIQNLPVEKGPGQMIWVVSLGPADLLKNVAVPWRSILGIPWDAVGFRLRNPFTTVGGYRVTHKHPASDFGIINRPQQWLNGHMLWKIKLYYICYCASKRSMQPSTNKFEQLQQLSGGTFLCTYTRKV